MMKKFSLALTLLVSLSASSFTYAKNQDFETTAHFSKVGEVDSFQWAPARYANNFFYDIFYYIPKSLPVDQKAKAIIFTHGGGQSTMDRPGSIKAVGLYMPDLKKMADELGIIVVLPSANGLNWGGHTRGLMKDLATLMRTELNIDPNRLGVSGHSMGGMGITRSYLWTADEFAFTLPMAAGMDEAIQNEEHLNKVFNLPYTHLQGRGDHFDIFIARCEAQLKNTKALEAKYGVASKLNVVFYEGSHNYDFNLFKTHLSKLLNDSPRDLYQKELWGSFYTGHSRPVENNIEYDADSEARYFWAELVDTDLNTGERIDFHAKIVGQRIEIKLPVLPKMSRGLKLYLHSKMLNLNEKVEVYINDTLAFVREAKEGVAKQMDINDPGFVFEDAVTIPLSL